MGSIVVVLLVACANVVNLLLVACRSEFVTKDAARGI
jgi:hypothetical protein